MTISQIINEEVYIMIVKYTEEREMTWEEIREAAAAKGLKSGTRIPITLKTGEELEVDVTYDEHGKAFFVFHNCLKEPRPMNKRKTNKDGWAASDLREEANGPILESFPDELRDMIAPTKIVQVINGKRIECEDKLFCLSFTQIAGKIWQGMNDMEPEDTQLDIFTGERSRVKECGEYGTFLWWERSPFIYIAGSFMHCYSSGYPYGSSYAYNAYGVCLGFCLNP